MSKVCPKCGAENKDNAIICNSCFNFFDKEEIDGNGKVIKKRSEKYENIIKNTGDLYKEYVTGLKEDLEKSKDNNYLSNEDIRKTIKESKEVFNNEEEKEKINDILEKVKEITPIAAVQNEDNTNNNNEKSNFEYVNINNNENSDNSEPIKEKNVQDEYDEVINEVVSAEYGSEKETSELEEKRIPVDNSKIEFPEENSTINKDEVTSSRTLKLKNKEKAIDDAQIEEADKDDEYEKAIDVFETFSNKKRNLTPSKKNVDNTDTNGNFAIKSKQDANKTQINPKLKKKKTAPKSALTIDKIIKNSIIISLVLLLIMGIVFFVGKRSQTKSLDEAIVILNSDNNSSYMDLYNSLVTKGYSSVDVENALSKSGIDFAENALNAAYECAKDTNKLNNKQNVKTLLEDKQFFDNEVSFALQSIDWEKYLKIFVDECILKTKELSKNSILSMIREANFSEEEVLKIEKYDAWTKLAVKNALAYINDKKAGKSSALEYLASLDYSQEEIDAASKEIDWKSVAKNYLTNIIKTDVNVEASRNSFKTILESAGFDEDEINNVLDKEDFSSYAKEELNDFLSTNEDAINKKDILKRFIDKGFNDKEVNEAMERVDWKKMSLTAIKTYDDGKRSLKELLDKLRELGYNEEEVEYAYTNYNWDTHTIYYIKNLIDDGKAGGRNNLVQLLTINNYPLAIINSSIKNFDFNTEALKALNTYISKAENCSKNKAREYLQGLKYDNTEINYAMESNTINWSAKAISFLSSVGYDSRVSARSALEAQGYTDVEISNVINNLDSNGSWRTQCLGRYNALLKDKGTAELCQEHSCFEAKNGGAYSVLKNEQYTDEEINFANSQISWPTNCGINPS